MMKAGVQTKLEHVFNYPFFRAAGNPLPPSVSDAKSWTHAVKEYDSRKWENCRLMARNALQRFVEQQNWGRRQDWNPLSDELRPKIVSFIEELLPKTGLPAEVTKKVKDNLSWDIMFICLEQEYSDVVKPFFYIPLLDPWYAAGHCPCGWDGEEFPDRWDGVIPEGKLIVF
jgi:hypothetical protein